jgi:hypothetical protein
MAEARMKRQATIEREDAAADMRTITVAVPGSSTPLVFERTADGRLLTISGGGRLYVDATAPNRVDYGQGFVVCEQTELPGGLIRRVKSRSRSWTEAYRWDTQGRLVEVDGVQMRYDGEGRIVACLGGANGDWLYGYSGAHLTVIDTPHGTRHVLRGRDGQPVGTREADLRTTIHYDAEGCRLPRRTWPPSWNVDAAGRLWTITDVSGQVVVTYLWDSRHCLGAIAGAPGAPLAAVYSLDPTATPVRVITEDSVRTLPRDAFGEGLLSEAGIPGLFGGAVVDGLVHLQYRRLDPRTGSFDAPDPMDGEKSDPRRQAGVTGPLPIELPAAGPYTVCRNNPVSLADPTGAISDLWWMIPSALTWSIQNTIGSLLGMWFNLQFSPLGWIISAAVGARPFDAEWIKANNHDAFGLRADGWLSRIQSVAWTYQFLVNEEEASFTALEDSRLFAPDAPFRPTLYGTVLRCVPATGQPFVLRGQRNAPNQAALTDWSRCGGTAEPAFPFSRFPVFPDGGIHFRTVMRGVREQRGQMIEIEPAGVIMTGVTGNASALVVPGTGLGLAVDARILLSDPAGIVDVARVLTVSEVAATTVLQIDSALTRLAAGAVRLEGLTPPAGTEALTPVAGQPRLLSVTGASNDYAPTVSVLRLSRAGAAVHAARVAGFETQLALDQPVPPGVAANFSVRLAVASGSFNGALTATATVFNMTSGALPAPGTGVLVGAAGATAIPAIVQSVAAPAVTVDRDLSALGPDGTAITGRLLAPGAELGVRRDAPEAESRVTYVPAFPAVAPDSGFIWIQGAITAVRRVTARTYDAIVMSDPRPDNQPDAYDVERFRLAAPDIGGVARSQVQTIALSAVPPSTTTAFHVVQFPGGAVAAGGGILTAATLAGTDVTASVTPTAPPVGLRSSEVVVLTPAAGAAQVAVIRRIRLTVALTRPLPLTASAETIGASLLALENRAYPAERMDGRVLRLQPVVGGTRIDMPRLVPGELVAAQWRVGTTANERLFRVLSVAGTTITCGDDEAEIPAGTIDITVARLLLGDPGTGTARIGIDGRVISNSEIQFSAWDASDYPDGFLLAVIDGQTVYAARVADIAQPLTLEVALAGAITGTVDVASVPAGAAAFGTTFTLEGSTLTLQDLPAAAAAAGFAAIVPYVDTARRVDGALHSGSVRIPDDHENASLELSRRQALEDHELMHTVQSARLGPLMLVAFPLWAFELAADLTAAGGPQFSTYIPGTLAAGRVTIPSSGGVTFEADDRIQIAQSRRSIFLELGPASAGSFALTDASRRTLAASGFLDGPIQVRRSLGGTGTDVLEWITNIGQLLTLGGLLNVVSIAGWGGVAAIITQIVKALRKAGRSNVNMQLALDQVTLQPPNPGAETLEDLAEGVLLAVRAGDKMFIRAILTLVDETITLGQPVPLNAGTVEVAVYSPGAAMFGLGKYFPANVTDDNRPARLTLSPVGGQSLSLSVHDRIEVRSASGSSYRTLVTAVDGSAIEIEEPALTRTGPGGAPEINELLVAKIAEEDPTGWVDSWMLNELSIGWMQYFHDPWGQILYRAQPDRSNTAAQIFARSARYLFGTQSWMCIFLGFFWNDNAYKQANPHRSRMEQEASRRSGDTYCPLGSLHGNVEVIGDIARYWFTCTGGARDGIPDLIAFSQQDAAGVNFVQAPTLTLPAGSAFSLPGDLYNLNGAGNFAAIGNRGWIPASSRLERSCGIYVAFSRPSPGAAYRITGQAAGQVAPADIVDSLDAQNDGAATLFFDRAPADVTVTAAGVAVAEDSTFSVIPFQRVAFAVQPNGARVYRATVAGQGTTFDAEGTNVTARGALVTDSVEISRFHQFDPATGSYNSGIGPIHLPADIDIGVRRFQMQIQDLVPLRSTIDHTAAAPASVRPGDAGLILVPAPLAPAPVTSAVTGTPSLTPAIDTPSDAIPAAVQEFLGDGGVLRIIIPTDQPPEQQATLTISIPVGPDAASAVAVRCEIVVDPHFTLESGGAFQVARGASIVLRSSDGASIEGAGTTAGITLTPANDQITVAVDASFGPNSVTILARDTANTQRLARRTLTVT